MIKPQRMTGPEAGVLKYDILTALSVAGLANTPGMCTGLMRLIALITARYNWQADEFCVGQRDMARMWSVDERTVKRQIKRLMEADILVCKRPGVRGRVGAYRLNYTAIARLSEPSWALVGPDFVARMQARYQATEVKVVQFDAYARAEEAQEGPKPQSPATGPWGRAMDRLKASDKAQYDAWFARLGFLGATDQKVQITCPSSFIQRYIETHLMPRLLNALEAEFGQVTAVTFHSGKRT